MSIKTSKQLAAAGRQIGLPRNVVRTFVALASYANFQGEAVECYPKQATIAKKAGWCVDTVRKHLKEIESKSFLLIEHCYHNCLITNERRQSSNLYTFDVEAIQKRVNYLLENPDEKQPVRKKSRLSASAPRTVKSKQKDNNRSSKADLLFNRLKDDPKTLLNQLINAAKFGSKQEAWTKRGRRYLCNADGGLYISKRYIGDIRGLIGFVRGSQAHLACTAAIDGITKWLEREENNGECLSL